MNNKCMQKEPLTKKEIEQEVQEILQYNIKVKEYLAKKSKLTPLEAAAIQNFKYNCQQNKYSDQEYNQRVEVFNRSGLYLKKRGVFVRANNRIGKPYLDSEAITISRNKFRVRMDEFNKEADEENLDIIEYNSAKVKPVYKLTLEEKEKIKQFKKDHKLILIREFNIEVEKFNLKNDFIIPKKKLVKFKRLSAPTVMNGLILFYGGFFKNYVLKQQKGGFNTSISKTKIPKLKLNISSFAKHKYENAPALGVTAQTIKNHFKILKEARVLQNYEFRGWQNEVKFNIDPEILFIKDGNPPKTQYDVNQFFKSKKSQTVDTIKHSLLLNIKKDKRYNDVIDIRSLITGSKPQSLKTSPAVSYKNARKQEGEKNTNHGAEISAEKKKISENARKLILTDIDFANNLFNGVYKNAKKNKPLRYDRINRIRIYSDLSWEEFTNLLTQDFLKTAYKNIYKHHKETTYVGCWYNTIQLIKNKWIRPILLGIKNGQTTNLKEKLEVFRWKFVRAGRFFKNHPNHNPLFPIDYFDLSRTTTKEMGFKGLDIAYKKHLKKEADKKREKKKKSNQEYYRKKEIRFGILFKEAVLKYFTEEYTYEQLCNYVDRNLGEKQQKQLLKYAKSNPKTT